MSGIEPEPEVGEDLSARLRRVAAALDEAAPPVGSVRAPEQSSRSWRSKPAMALVAVSLVAGLAVGFLFVRGDTEPPSVVSTDSDTPASDTDEEVEPPPAVQPEDTEPEEQLATLDIPADGQQLGQLEIGAINLNVPVLEGLGLLASGPGHYPTSALPGTRGNAVIAGHRSIFGAPFQHLDELVVGDEIAVRTASGTAVYVVVGAPGTEGAPHIIVEPDDTALLQPSDRNLLTLTTNHPRFSARQRLVVRAELQGAPLALTTPSAVDPVVAFAQAPDPAELEPLCGIDPPLEVVLPGESAELPSSTSTTGDGEGRLVETTSNAEATVVVEWPARPQQLYDLDGDVDRKIFAPAYSYDEGNRTLLLQFRSVEPPFLLTGVPAPADPACSRADVTLYRNGQLVARFGWDLAAPASWTPLVDIRPLIVRSTASSTGPEDVLPCSSPGATESTLSGAGSSGPAATPADALSLFLASDGAVSFPKSGWREFVLDDSSYVYGAPFEVVPGAPDPLKHVVVATVKEDAEGWSVETWSASGC